MERVRATELDGFLANKQPKAYSLQCEIEESWMDTKNYVPSIRRRKFLNTENCTNQLQTKE